MSGKKIEIAYLGPKGTFSHEALKAFLANENTPKSIKDAELIELNNFILFETYLLVPEIDNDNKIFIPIENSIGGSIPGNIDTLFWNNEENSNIQIEAEHIQPIRHSIANLTGNLDDITMIASHEQPIRQCSKYITDIKFKYLLDKDHEAPTKKYTASTVAGVEMAKKDKTIAAIAPHQTLIDAGLKIIADDIQDNNNNATRFVLVGHDKTQSTGNDKTSIAITLPADKAGALYEVLGILANSIPAINMTKIESRPAMVKMGEYWFFIDIEGHQDDEHIEKALEKIKELALDYRFLGSYPRFRR